MKAEHYGYYSRNELIEHLHSLGIYEDDVMNTFSDDVLRAILLSMDRIYSIGMKNKGHNSKAHNKLEHQIENGYGGSDISGQVLPLLHPSHPKLANSDKKILKVMLNAKERLSVLSLSRQSGIPLATVQRRLKKLESQYVSMKYSLCYQKLGLRRAILLISVSKGSTEKTGGLILDQRGVVSVGRVIGGNNASLKSEVLFNNNKELMIIIDTIRSLPGIEGVIWMEIIDVVKTKPDAILDLLEEEQVNTHDYNDLGRSNKV